MKNSIITANDLSPVLAWADPPVTVPVAVKLDVTSLHVAVSEDVATVQLVFVPQPVALPATGTTYDVAVDVWTSVIVETLNTW